MVVLGVPAVVIVASLAFLYLHRTGSPSTGPTFVSTGPSVDPAALPGIDTGPPPWPAEVAKLKARLQAIGLPALSSEGTVLHIHQHLDLFVDGRKVTVPADIGINTQEQFLSPLHTHDTTGIIHVESPTQRDFTLGQFFDVWGVRFTSNCIGAECAGAGKALRVYVDGLLVSGDPRQVKLIAHAEIVVAFGTAGQIPQPVPSSYSFPFGL
jgi:hypothetical protein